MIRAERRALNAQELHGIKWHADKDRKRREEASERRHVGGEDDFSALIQLKRDLQVFDEFKDRNILEAEECMRRALKAVRAVHAQDELMALREYMLQENAPRIREVAKRKTLAILTKMGLVTQLNEPAVRAPLPRLPTGGHALWEYMDTYIRPSTAALTANLVAAGAPANASRREEDFLTKISSLLNVPTKDVMLHMGTSRGAAAPGGGGGELTLEDLEGDRGLFRPAPREEMPGRWAQVGTLSNLASNLAGESRALSSAAADPYRVSGVERIRLARRRSYTPTSLEAFREGGVSLSPSPVRDGEIMDMSIIGAASHQLGHRYAEAGESDWEGLVRLSIEGVTMEREERRPWPSPSPEPEPHPGPILSVGVIPSHMWPSADQV